MNPSERIQEMVKRLPAIYKYSILFNTYKENNYESN